MTCTDFLGQLTDYIDGEIDAVLLEALNRHAVACRPCGVLLVTTKQTIEIFRKNEVCDFSFAIRERVRSAIMDKCRAQRTGCLLNSSSSIEAASTLYTTTMRVKVLYLRGERSSVHGQTIDEIEFEA